MAEPELVIGDLGGTYARFALAHPDPNNYTAMAVMPCAAFASAAMALEAYLEKTGVRGPAVIALSVAGPVVGGSVRFINSDWILDKSELESRFSPANVTLMNDFGAIACSIPHLRDQDIEPIGFVSDLSLVEKGDINVAVIGPGTGLGISGLVIRDGVSCPIAGEGGHMGFAPQSPAQMAVHQQLNQRFGRVSNERLLSGPGIENIYQALIANRGKEPPKTSAAEIFQKAIDREDEIASQAVQLFFEILGQVAGDLALALGAFDGVYIAGGIVPRYAELLKASRFREGFENKGRHRALVEQIPTVLVTHPQPGLIGVSHIARMLNKQSRHGSGGAP